MSTLSHAPPSPKPPQAQEKDNGEPLPPSTVPDSDKLSPSDDIHLLLEAFPGSLRDTIVQARPIVDLIEIILDLGRVPEARYTYETVRLNARPVDSDTIEHVVQHVGGFSHDNRAGIPRTLHRISALRNRAGNIVGLTCRVGRAVFGTVEIVKDLVQDESKSILLLGPPGIGKTTLLREAARVSADEDSKRVVIVDTSNEIAGDGDIPHAAIGQARRMQVPSPDLQHRVMIEAVENHMPEVIVVDEIGTEAEAAAARTIAERGVRLVATAHGGALHNLILNPTLADLIGGVQSVTLGDDEARRRRSQKTVRERKGPPTFDILIEIHTRDRFIVHPDVAASVDSFLRGWATSLESRTREPDGTINIEQLSIGTESSPKSGSTSDHADDGNTRHVLRVFPYGINKHRLEHTVHKLDVPARVVSEAAQADLVLTVKGQTKRQPKALRELIQNGTPLYTLRSDTASQLAKFLRDQLSAEFPDDRAAISEAEEVVQRVIENNEKQELAPQRARLRRLQHQVVESYGLISRSTGDDPGRRLIIYPTGR